MVDCDTFTKNELRFERDFDAPVETVWRWLVEPDLRARWFMAGPSDLRVGGTLGLTFDHARLSDREVPTPERYAGNVGMSWSETIERFEPPHLIAFGWEGGQAGTVTIELAPSDGGTRLTLIHTGLRGADDARNFGGGWRAHLEVLQRRIAGKPVPDFWVLHREAEEKAAAAVG